MTNKGKSLSLLGWVLWRIPELEFLSLAAWVPADPFPAEEAPRPEVPAALTALEERPAAAAPAAFGLEECAAAAAFEVRPAAAALEVPPSAAALEEVDLEDPEASAFLLGSGAESSLWFL